MGYFLQRFFIICFCLDLPYEHIKRPRKLSTIDLLLYFENSLKITLIHHPRTTWGSILITGVYIYWQSLHAALEKGAGLLNFWTQQIVNDFERFIRVTCVTVDKRLKAGTIVYSFSRVKDISYREKFCSSIGEVTGCSSKLICFDKAFRAVSSFAAKVFSSSSVNAGTSFE